MESQQQVKQRSMSPTKTQVRETSPKRTVSPTRQQQRSVSPTKRTRSPSPTSKTTTRVNIRQNFSDEAETKINELIHVLMVGGYQAIAMASFFDRDEVGLFGMAHFSKWTSTEIYHVVRMLMDYLVIRGGRVCLGKIDKPNETEWKTPIDALELLLKMKEIVYDKVVDLHRVAGEQQDGHLNDFLETVILRPLVACNRQLVVLVSNLKRAGPALGEYQFNKHLEQYLHNILSNPNLSYLAHGGVDYLNMYRPPPQTPIDFSSILGQLVQQSPTLKSLNLSDLIHLVGNINTAPMIRQFRHY